MKRCIVEMTHGVKVSKLKVVNPNVPVELTPKEIFTLLKRNKVKVFEMVGKERIRLNIDNYRTDHSSIRPTSKKTVKGSNTEIVPPTGKVVEDTGKPVEKIVEDSTIQPVEEVIIEDKVGEEVITEDKVKETPKGKGNNKQQDNRKSGKK